MSASMEARIAEHAAAPIPPINPAYDQAPLGHRAAMIPESSVATAARPPRAADRAKDVGYVRALQASEHRMVTSIEEVNLESATKHRKLHEVVRLTYSEASEIRHYWRDLKTLELT
ncbi:hypothetical protein Tco_0949668 [Tanacetum coccineum]